MDARSVEDARIRIRELRLDQRSQLGLAALVLGLAVAASLVLPELALPLFLGGIAVGALGVLALWRRWDLVDRLSGDRDAHAIAEVHEYALRRSRPPDQ